MSVPTFVVGTGRCGSTMLSNMLREHPLVLNLSEFFAIVTNAGRLAEAFVPEPIDGRAFWALVTLPPARNNFAMQHDVAAPELLYPWDDPSARFSAKTGVPSIAITTLPHLTDDPDGLFEMLDAEVATWPVAPITEHYRHLFDWLTRHFGKRLWVERSGSSLMLVEQMKSMFSDARFVHITRDGRDTCLSMQAHLGFRIGFLMAALEQFLGVDPLLSSDRTRLGAVPESLRAFLPEHFDAEAFRAFAVPLPVLGRLWAQQIDAGMKSLSTLPADRVLTLRYEDFFTDPRRQLDAVAAFLGTAFVDEAWSARCAAKIRPARSTWRSLPGAEIDALTEVCRPGFEHLRAMGVAYEI